MTPEELRALAAAVAEARRAGHSVEEINASFQRQGLPFQSVQDLQGAMQEQGIQPPQQQPQTGGGGGLGPEAMPGQPDMSPEEQAALQRQAQRPGGGPSIPTPFGDVSLGGISDFGRMAAQGATARFGDEFVGLLGGIKSGVQAAREGRGGGLLGSFREGFQEGQEEATEASRQRVEDIRTLNPGSAAAAEAVGAILTGTGGLAAGRQVMSRVAPKVAQALPQAGQSIARFLRGPSTGAARLTPTMQIGRGTAIGAGAGGGGAAAQAAGESEGGLLERAAAGAKAVPGGAAVGGLLGLGVAFPGAAFGRRGATGRTKHAGETIADDWQATSGRSRPPSVIRESSDVQARTARRIFQRLENEGVVPQKIDDLVRSDKVLSAELRRLKGLPEDIRKGDAPITFTQADDIAKNLKEEAGFYARGGGGTTPGRSDRVRQATEKFDRLDSAMRESLEGYPEAKALWARSNAELRALSEGRKMVSRTADDIEDGLRRLPQEVGMPSGLNPAERVAYAEELQKIAQEGMLHEHVARLRSTTGSAFRPSAEARKMFNAGPETRAQIRQVFPDDASFREFEALLKSEADASTIAQKLSVLIAAGAFLRGGTSVFAKLFTE